jgi:nitrile hydratase
VAKRAQAARQTVENAPGRFAAGDRVRVLAMYPLGHVRTPWYIRGKTGVVERLCGAYPNPEELAYQRSGLPAQACIACGSCSRMCGPSIAAARPTRWIWRSTTIGWSPPERAATTRRDMSSAHDDHSHATHPDSTDHLTYYQTMEIAVRELLIEKGIVTADDVRRQVEDMDGRNAGLGAKMVARAWVDPDYKHRMLADGNAAAVEVGLDHGIFKLVVVENTPQIHNVIVCTLCSCYPRWLLGLPPDWYKSRSYRSRVVREPRLVLREFGLDLPDDVTVRVHDSNADMRYLVLPMRPMGTEELSENQLAALATRDSMIGVTVAVAAR